MTFTKIRQSVEYSDKDKDYKHLKKLSDFVYVKCMTSGMFLVSSRGRMRGVGAQRRKGRGKLWIWKIYLLKNYVNTFSAKAVPTSFYLNWLVKYKLANRTLKIV